MLSKSQIDKLGQRLRLDQTSDSDLTTLNEYRHSFSGVHDIVVRTIRENLGLEPTGRQAKTTESITEKLRREPHMCLSRMQDIAGCRLTVSDLTEQDAIVSRLVEMFPGCVTHDRRQHPSHGYRAVHVIARMDGISIEIQVRTVLQHLWAEVCEKLADEFGLVVKYGGGDAKVRDALARLSNATADVERFQAKTLEIRQILEEEQNSADSIDLTETEAAQSYLRSVVQHEELIRTWHSAMNAMDELLSKAVEREERTI